MIFDYFGALSLNLFFGFYPARQVPEIFLNESFKKLKMPLLEASERDHKVIYENQSLRGFFGFKSSFHNCFSKHFNISDLSQICKIRNVWNNLISSSEKTYCSLKKSFCPINSITVFEFI
jgi:hypothetical protein